MPKSIDQLRRDAKALRQSYEARDTNALQRVKSAVVRGRMPVRHADFLHIIARENGFESWPRLTWAHETIGLDRAAKQQKLKQSIAHGQNWRVVRLLEETPDLTDGLFGVQCALYMRAEVEAALEADPSLAVHTFGPRRPIVHLAYSKWIKARPELETDMLAIARLLVSHGADVNDTYDFEPGGEHKLSVLYGAIGHADNMVLGKWLLEQGADPNDGESLYHATELGHHEGLRMLLDHGADPTGTNALLRAMDFDDVTAVAMLIQAGARADDFNADKVGGEAPYTVPALHQAARRMSSAKMVDLLISADVDPQRRFEGLSPYAAARVFGNSALAAALDQAGQATPLSSVEAMLAEIADGTQTDGVYLNPEGLPEGARNIVRDILHLPGKLPHLKRLVAAGAEYDRPDKHEGVTPVQAAGWLGLPEVLAFFLSLKPDLEHVNNYGGTLLSTILHGSENNPDRRGSDYVACLQLVMEHGIALPRGVLDQSGVPEIAAFLSDWAEAHPGQVVEHGVT